MSADRVALSVVVVAYDMQRELSRTLRSLAPPYQREISAHDYELVVIDNGSPTPVTVVDPDELGVRIRVHRIEEGSASPARAANLGVEVASGELVGLVIDGARMASPGLLHAARVADAAVPNAIVTAPAWQLGSSDAAVEDLDARRAEEDALLERCGWVDDGYALFSVAMPARSSARGLFGPMGESSSLFMRRERWSELGGLDERFTLPGGGLVNHDLYRRACALPDAQLVVLVGEGTFHQHHGGAATSGRVTRDEMRADYESITGASHRPPGNQPLFVGSVPPQYLDYVASSVALAQDAAARRRVHQ